MNRPAKLLASMALVVSLAAYASAGAVEELASYYTGRSGPEIPVPVPVGVAHAVKSPPVNVSEPGMADVHESVTVKNVEFSWTMNSVADVRSYKVYYAYSADMSGQLWHQDCNSPTPPESVPGAFSMICKNVVISPYPLYYAIASVTSKIEVQSDSFTLLPLASPVSPVQGFQIIRPQGVIINIAAP